MTSRLTLAVLATLLAGCGVPQAAPAEVAESAEQAAVAEPARQGPVVSELYESSLADGYSTPQGRVQPLCVRVDEFGSGTAQYSVDGDVLAEVGRCDEESERITLISEAVYPSGERILHFVSGSGLTGTSGVAIRLAPGRKPAAIPVEYLLGWSQPDRNPNRIGYGLHGHDESEQEVTWACELEVDWSVPRIIQSKSIEGPADICDAPTNLAS